MSFGQKTLADPMINQIMCIFFVKKKINTQNSLY